MFRNIGNCDIKYIVFCVVTGIFPYHFTSHFHVNTLFIDIENHTENNAVVAVLRQ